MSKPIKVKMGDGTIAVCAVVEHMGFNHGIGAKTAWVEYRERQFMAIWWAGGWRKWTAGDRVQPIIEWAERERLKREVR